MKMAGRIKAVVGLLVAGLLFATGYATAAATDSGIRDAVDPHLLMGVVFGVMISLVAGGAIIWIRRFLLRRLRTTDGLQVLARLASAVPSEREEARQMLPRVIQQYAEYGASALSSWAAISLGTVILGSALATTSLMLAFVQTTQLDLQNHISERTRRVELFTSQAATLAALLESESANDSTRPFVPSLRTQALAVNLAASINVNRPSEGPCGRVQHFSEERGFLFKLLMSYEVDFRPWVSVPDFSGMDVVGADLRQLAGGGYSLAGARLGRATIRLPALKSASDLRDAVLDSMIVIADDSTQDTTIVLAALVGAGMNEGRWRVEQTATGGSFVVIPTCN